MIARCFANTQHDDLRDFFSGLEGPIYRVYQLKLNRNLRPFPHKSDLAIDIALNFGDAMLSVRAFKQAVEAPLLH
ncbi:hypothetical protein SDC9_202858 [bioreactor metagenome]|uniref:Uncharacterized protein n=1 Tax=bioreactor metagenome TaxID=1076179 RepID=A0A645IXL7_9ZZZZ